MHVRFSIQQEGSADSAGGEPTNAAVLCGRNGWFPHGDICAAPTSLYLSGAVLFLLWTVFSSYGLLNSRRMPHTVMHKPNKNTTTTAPKPCDICLHACMHTLANKPFPLVATTNQQLRGTKHFPAILSTLLAARDCATLCDGSLCQTAPENIGKDEATVPESRDTVETCHPNTDKPAIRGIPGRASRCSCKMMRRKQLSHFPKLGSFVFFTPLLSRDSQVAGPSTAFPVPRCAMLSRVGLFLCSSQLTM